MSLPKREREEHDISPLCCFLCRNLLPSASALPLHLLGSHSVTIPDWEEVCNVSEWTNTIAEIVGEQFACPVCRTCCGKLSTLEEHLAVAAKTSSLSCSTWSAQTISALAPLMKRGVDDDEAASTDSEEETDDEDDNVEDNGSDAAPALCLYCNESTADPSEHSQKVHNADLVAVLHCAGCKNDYDRIKVVNFIRSRVAQQNCPLCEYKAPSAEELRGHIERETHFGPTEVPGSEEWLRPQVRNDGMVQFVLSVGWMDDGPDEDYPMVPTLVQLAQEHAATAGPDTRQSEQ